MAWVTELKPDEELVIDGVTRISLENRAKIRIRVTGDGKRHKIEKRAIGKVDSHKPTRVRRGP